MPRYALKLEYDGGSFAGWQRQAAEPSVQGTLERALRQLEPGSGAVTGAGRTDAGVHARGQVAHVDLARDWEPFRLAEALNFHLRRHPVAVLAAAVVAPDFSARFSAVERRYMYRVIRRRAPLVIERGQAWRLRHRIDAGAMRVGAAHLVGRHDFTTFRSSSCQAQSPVKTLDEIRIEESPGEAGAEVRFHLRARSFLHNQVRSIVGTLERVGAGAWHPDRVAAALAARDRAACGQVAPPEGLCLVAVRYADDPFATWAGTV